MDEQTTGNVTGQLAARRGVRRDISEPQHILQDPRRAAHFALLGQLAAAVVHEISNPLSTVFLHLDMIEEELQQLRVDPSAQMAASVAGIRTELMHLYEVVQNSLTLVRLASIQRVLTDVGAFVETFGLEIAERLMYHGVALRLEGLAHLGQVPLHKSALRRALLNLVQNALDAMPDGGTLTLRGQRTETGISLAVSDTGNGIAVEDVPLIFTPLYTTKPDGTGLGLYIVQEIVAAHGGTITVRSVPGTGTTFTIMLPCLAGEAKPPCQEEQA